jgi:MFS family permease
MSQQDSGSQPTTAELVRRLSDQTSQLVRQELELAKAEVSVKAKQAGVGAGLFGAAAVVGLYAGGALIAGAIAALALAVATWLAALIVAVVLAVVGGVLALQGRSKVKHASPPTPEAAIQTTKTSVGTLKERARAGRQNA